MIKHGYNQWIKPDFNIKFLHRQAQQTGSADKEKIIQIDNIQLVKCVYLCHELKMELDGVCHLYDDRLVC